jgi:hypothetical protein
MEPLHRIQGRDLGERDVVQIRDLLSAHPQWSRNQLDIELARTWNWRTASGQLKTMAAHSLLLKLEQRGWITLPPRRRLASRRLPITSELPLQERVDGSITAGLHELAPLTLDLVAAGHPDFSRYLARHHYLGYRGPVGENLGYLARDRQGRDVACLLFGAAAWKAAPRDRFIGWSDDARAKRVNWITNNTRFLVLPWVRVPHLASHLLALALRRLSADWQAKYGHPVYLVETFVDRSRFKGTCYRAANWTCVGQTQGRSRQDHDRTLSVPVKDIHLYPLVPDFRERLCRLDP